MSIPPRGIRSWHQSPYHLCARCDDRTHLSVMTWQRGLLLCPTCVDTGVNPLVGQRELDIIRAFETPTHEMEPSPKLTSPDPGISGDDLITF